MLTEQNVHNPRQRFSIKVLSAEGFLRRKAGLAIFVKVKVENIGYKLYLKNAACSMNSAEQKAFANTENVFSL